MRKLTLIVFPSETRAFQGFHALQQLRSEGSVFVFGAAVVERDEDGTLFVKKRSREVPLGAALGALVGSFRKQLPEYVAPDLAPGTSAVVAETSGDWGTPLHGRMEAIGGSVVCEWWKDVGDVALEQRTRRNAAVATRTAEPSASTRGSNHGVGRGGSAAPTARDAHRALGMRTRA